MCVPYNRSLPEGEHDRDKSVRDADKLLLLPEGARQGHQGEVEREQVVAHGDIITKKLLRIRQIRSIIIITYR